MAWISPVHGRREWLLTDRAHAFFDTQHSIAVKPRPRLPIAVRPPHFNPVDLLRLSQAEVEGEGALGVVAAAADDVGELFPSAGVDCHAGADGAAVGLCSG